MMGMLAMSVDQRIRFLLRTALRAEGEGDLRVAELFRRMADELRPLGRTLASVVDLLEEGRSEYFGRRSLGIERPGRCWRSEIGRAHV